MYISCPFIGWSAYKIRTINFCQLSFIWLYYVFQISIMMRMVVLDSDTSLLPLELKGGYE